MGYSERDDDEDLFDKSYAGDASEPIVKIKRLWNHHNTAFAFIVVSAFMLTPLHVWHL